MHSFFLANNYGIHSVSSLWMTHQSSMPLHYAEMPDVLTVSTILNSQTNQSDSSPLQSVFLALHPFQTALPTVPAHTLSL